MRDSKSLTIVAIASVGLLVAILEPSALISFAAAYLIVAAISLWFDRTQALVWSVTAMTVVHAASLVLYAVQFISLPDYIGFSGGLGVGTDDYFFYTTGATDIDGWFLARRYYLNSPFFYSTILGVVLDGFYTLFGYNHPLQAILLNNAGLALTPIFARGLMARFAMSARSQDLAFLLCLFGPFLIANGAILIRDGWITACTIGTVASLLSKRWLLAAALFVVALAMRLESAVLILGNAFVMAGVLWATSLDSQNSSVKIHVARVAFLVTLALSSIAAVFVFPEALISLSADVVLGRPEYVADFIRSRAVQEGGTTTLYQIAQQPFPVRQILGFIFFFGAPFLALENIVVDGVFVLRALLTNLSSIVFIVTLPLFVNAVLGRRLWDCRGCIALLVIFVVDIFVLAEFSMQIRHKSSIIPLYYSLVAIGISSISRATLRFGMAVATLALCVNLAVTAINLL